MRRRAAPLPRAVLAQLKLELKLAFRRGESLLVTIIVPVMLLLFFGAVPIVPTGEASPVGFLLPGLLALAIMSTGMVSLGISTAFDRQYGVLKLLGGTPLPRAGLVLAKMTSVVLVELVQVLVLVTLAATLFNWQPGPNALLALPLLILGTLAFSGLGLLMAGALRAEATLALANGLYLLFLLLGDMVVPLGMLPSWLAAVAHLLPAAAFADALRAALQPQGDLPAGSWAALATWSLAAPLAAARAFRWE